MGVGVSEMWGQSEGLYYIDNATNHFVATSSRYYLIPADDPQKPDKNDAFYSSDYSSENGDPKKPFLTTYKTNKDAADVPEGVVNDLPNNSVWILKAVSGESGYFYIIHASSGKYVVYDPPYSAKPNRKAMHLLATDSPGENAKFEITVKGSGYNIRPQSVTEGNRFFNPSGSNQDYYHGNGGTDGVAVNYIGTIGLYSDSGGNSTWYTESTLLAAPTISDVDESTNTFTITDANSLPTGYTIRYTTDGTPPTATTGTEYSGPVLVADDWNVKAIVVRYGIVLTEVATKALSPLVAKPVISFNNSTCKVSIISSTAGAAIYYNTGDGSQAAPTTNSTLYSAPFEVTNPTIVKAISSLPGVGESSVTTLAIAQVATPTIQSNGSNAISITCATAGATIYYTTDGSTPTTSSTQYTSPLTDNVSNVTIKAIAVKENMITSAVGSGTVMLQCALPVITRDGLSFTVACNMPSDASIYYSLDGNTPTTAYSGAVTFTVNQLPMTVSAVAKHANYTDSEIATFILKNGDGTAAEPYLIYNASDFARFVSDVNDGTTSSACYKLEVDVSASNASAITTTFTGSFDGSMHTISGLSKPLFASTAGAVVKNVMLKEVGIEQSGNIGALVGEAGGYTRIYNCGILPKDATNSTPSTVKSTNGYCGGLVGWLKDDSRVINCFSYANITGGTDVAGIVGYNEAASNTTVTDGQYVNLRTAVVNCMFYGDITGGTNKYPVYGGAKMLNNAANGINNYDFYRAAATFTPSDYNCSWPALEENLTRFEYYRYLLNANRELCGWWVGAPSAPSTMSTADVQAVPKDASLMAKWVLDPSIAPYPILKPAGKYPSVINPDSEKRYNPSTTKWVNRTISSNTIQTNKEPDTQGQTLGSITVSINAGSHHSGSTSRPITITAMDIDNNDFCYGKIQLPYYNEIFGDPDGTSWSEKYGDNYTDMVVTGWEVTSSGGTNSFSENWETGYNFADRNSTDKDSHRIFAQGGYYYVPYGVNSITITAHWANAYYLSNTDTSYERLFFSNAKEGKSFAPAGTRSHESSAFGGETINSGTIQSVLTSATAASTVYDCAVVLVGNYQYKNSDIGVTDDNEYDSKKPFTLMTVDLDFDNEPDYCLEWQIGNGTSRALISPVRFDFLPIVELGYAMKENGSTNLFAIGKLTPLGHFEVTETAIIHMGQFEFENENRKLEGPVILNNGVFEQISRGTQSGTGQHITYFIVGGHVKMPQFTPGSHVREGVFRHCAVNVLGGEFAKFFLSGNFKADVKANKDNPHCYIDGGKLDFVASGGKEQIDGNVFWKIDHAYIGEFYGGGINSDKPVTGSIDISIDRSRVTKFCGGPQFGDMAKDMTVTTSATGTKFGVYYGAGNGGTCYSQFYTSDFTTDNPDWETKKDNVSGGMSTYSALTYRNKATGYHAKYELEMINSSAGTANNAVCRTYMYAAQFATTNTGNVTNTLTDCTVETDFFGGGLLGGVTGSVTSTLSGNTIIDGSVYGAGYGIAELTVDVLPKEGYTAPTRNANTAVISAPGYPTATTYYWTHNTSYGSATLSTSSPAILNPNGDGKNYLYTEISLDNLGTVTKNVTLTLKGNTKVGTSGTGHNVYGGGDQSAVTGNTIVELEGNTRVFGDVYGGGEESAVGGNTNITIGGATVSGNVYGGGKLGAVGTFTTTINNGSKEYTWTNGTGVCNVNINGGAVGSGTASQSAGNVFGGGKGEAKDQGDGAFLCEAAIVKATQVNIGNGSVSGYVYGGGEIGRVNDNTEVTIGLQTTTSAPVIKGSVFAAGKGVATHGYSALVRGNSSVTIQGNAKVWLSVYGGGEIASVGKYTLDAQGKPVALANSNSGHCTVIVRGNAEIGYDGMTMITESGLPDDAGHVFGAGMGVLPYENVTGDPWRMQPSNTKQWFSEDDYVAGTNDDEDYKQAYLNYIETLALATQTYVTIGGNAFVKGSVYGGSMNGHVQHDTNVTIEGGQIGCGKNTTARHPDQVWGDNYTPTTDLECASWDYTAPYASYDIYDLDANGNPKPATDGHTFYGNVFGGGSGYYPYSQNPDYDDDMKALGYTDGLWHRDAGSVGGNTVVNITGGHILTNVYGGNEQTDVTGTCTVNISGGTVGVPRTKEQMEAHPVTGFVFGGGKGDQRINFNTWTNVASTEVNISGTARIYGATFGGGENGHVLGNADTNISGSVVIGTSGTSEADGNVFGGGQGSVTALTAGVVGGCVNLDIEGGHILGSVYGGGQIASVGSHFAQATDANYGKMQEDDSHGIIAVNLTGGTIEQNVYGGCMGANADTSRGVTEAFAAQLGISKNVTVELNNGVADNAKGCAVRGSIFGCNNVNSSPEGTVMVHVYATQNAGKQQIANTPATNETAAVTDAKTLDDYDVNAVYGGGNMAAYVPRDLTNGTTSVIIDGCYRTSIKQVYGGGNAASTPATNVTVNGSFEIDEVFGGGNGKDDLPNGDPNPGANVGFKAYDIDADNAQTPTDRATNYGYGTGSANVNIFGGTIHKVFGGSNTKGNVRHSAVTMLEEAGGCDFCVDEAYGGGKSAPMDAEAKLLMSCIPGLKVAYGGAQEADIQGNVTLNITNGTFDRVFGGNNISGTIRGAITVNIEEVGCKPIKIGELYGGGNQAGYSVYGYDADGKPKESGDRLHNDPQVNVKSFTSIGNIYGGGYGAGATMVGNPTVNVNVAYGKYYDNDVSVVGDDAKTPGNYPLPSHAKGKIGAINNVFGGGNAAKVIGNTTVNIATLSEVSVIKDLDAGTTENKAVIGADIRGDVYGGGNNAEVTGSSNVNIGKKQTTD